MLALAGRSRVFLFLLLGSLLPSISAQGAADPFEAVLSLEQQGLLKAALKQLRASEDLLKAHQEHEAALVAFLHTSDLVEISRAKNQLPQAQAALEALLPKLDPLRDAHLLHAAQLKLVNLREQARGLAKKDMDRADGLVTEGKYAEAIALYKDVAESNSPDIPAALKREARQAMARAEVAKTEAETVGFLGKTWKSASEGFFTLAGWSIFLFIGALLVWWAGFSRKRRLPREETLIVLEDLTAQAAEREVMSQGLIREVLLRFGSLGKGEDRAADIDTLADIDGSAQANLRVEADPLTDIESIIQDSTPVQIGPFSLSPRQFFGLIRTYFRRPWRSRLAGSLVQQGEQTLLLVERSIDEGGVLRVDRWEARANGKDARTIVVQRMATRIAFELAKTRLTSDWRSFEAYREAMVHIAQAERDENRESLLEEACRDLQRSLRHDPANWIARFNLGAMQRKLGLNESAAKHFEFLEWMASGGANGTGPMADFLKTNPEFHFTLRYNRAVALSKITGWKPHHEAVRLLDELVTAVTAPPADGQPGLEEVARKRLEMLARSARAAALTFELERSPTGQRSAKDNERRRQYQNTVYGKIDQERIWIKALPLATAQLDWKAYSLSYAVTHNAFGRACHLLGRDGAVEALREALTMSPDFAESYITLAENYMRKEPLDWGKQVEDLLKRALEINSSNQKAHYLMGKLYANPAVANYTQAKFHLEKAELFPWSYIVLAQILAKEEGKVDEALRKVRRSIALDPQPDFRFELFVRYALQVLASQKSPSADLLAEAKQVAQRLTKSGKKMGQWLLNDLDKLASERPPKPAPPSVARDMEPVVEEQLPCPPAKEGLTPPLPPPLGTPPVA